MLGNGEECPESYAGSNTEMQRGSKGAATKRKGLVGATRKVREGPLAIAGGWGAQGQDHRHGRWGEA